MKIKNKQTSRQTIVFCGYDEDLSASTLHGEHYLRFMCTTKRIRPLHEGSQTFLRKIIMLRERLEIRQCCFANNVSRTWSIFVASSVEVWKFWTKLWIFVWPWCLAAKIMAGIKGWIKLRCMCTLKVSIFWWKLQTPEQILPSTENFPLTVNLTTELLLPCDRYSSVKNDYTLPQSFSHGARLTNAVGENSLKEKKKKKKKSQDMWGSNTGI